MASKLNKSIISIVCFLCGSLIVYIGLSKGYDIAKFFTRVELVDSWYTSKNTILVCTYIPVIIGISFIIVSLISAKILFINRTNKIN